MGYGIISLPQIIAICPLGGTGPLQYCNFTNLRNQGHGEIYLSLAYGTLDKVTFYLMITLFVILLILFFIELIKFINNFFSKYSFKRKLYILIPLLVTSYVFLRLYWYSILVCIGIFSLPILVVILLWSCINVIYLKKPPLFKLPMFKSKYVIAICSIFLRLFFIRTVIAIIAIDQNVCSYEYTCKPEELPF